MAAYKVPAELYEFYAKIKTPLSRRVAILILSDKTANSAYRQACKELKRKLSKNPRKSAYQIATNSDVSRFVNLAKQARQTVEINESAVNFNQRSNWLKKIVELRISRATSSAEYMSMADAVAAIRVLNDMYAEQGRFDGVPLDELRRMAGEPVEGDE